MKPTGLFIAFASNFCTSSTDEPSFLRLYSQLIVSGCRLQSRPRNLHRSINLVDYYFVMINCTLYCKLKFFGSVNMDTLVKNLRECAMCWVLDVRALSIKYLCKMGIMLAKLVNHSPPVLDLQAFLGFCQHPARGCYTGEPIENTVYCHFKTIVVSSCIILSLPA